MGQALALFLVLGVALGSAWLWHLQQSIASFRQTTSAQAKQMASLKAAIAESKANAIPVDPGLVSQLQDRQGAVVQREQLIDIVRQGVFKPGQRHSDRLLMLSRSIPPSVWITALAVDQGRMEISGFTLETQALNLWVASLAKYPLMQDLKLSTVTVEHKTGVRAKVLDALANTDRSAVGGDVGVRPVWSFKLVNLEPPAPAVQPASAPAKGASL